MSAFVLSGSIISFFLFKEGMLRGVPAGACGPGVDRV